jgi:cell division protein FtsB
MKKLILKYPILKLVLNKYALVSIPAFFWLLFFDQNSYLAHRKLDKEINAIKKDIKYYESEIEKDQKTLANLASKNTFERIAREQYLMKKPNEEVFIIKVNNE